MKRFITILGILGIILGIGGYYYFFMKNEPVRYRMARVEKGDIVAMISATGTINPVINVQVGSQVSGIIQALYADYNSEVKKDQVIAQLDPSTFQAQVTQAIANLESARANLKNVEADIANLSAGIENAQANLKTAKANVEKAQVAVKDAAQNLQRRLELFKAALISASDRDTAQTAYDSAVAQLKAAQAQEASAEAQLKSTQAQYRSALAKRDGAMAAIKQAEAALDQAKVNLEHTTIRSPIDGIVISRNVDVGQTVAASLQAPTLFTIAQDLTKMLVDTNVDETDIGKVRVGQEVIFTVSAYPGETFSGKVTQIRNQPITTQNVVTYDTLIEVDNPELKLKPGMTATVSIILAKREGVKRVLNAALNFKPDFLQAGKNPMKSSSQEGNSDGSGTAYGLEKRDKNSGSPKPSTWGTRRVWILSESGPRPVSVEVGLTDGTYTEIKGDSLQEGQEVIIGTEGFKATSSQQSGRPPSFGRPF